MASTISDNPSKKASIWEAFLDTDSGLLNPFLVIMYMIRNVDGHYARITLQLAAQVISCIHVQCTSETVIRYKLRYNNGHGLAWLTLFGDIRDVFQYRLKQQAVG